MATQSWTAGNDEEDVINRLVGSRFPYRAAKTNKSVFSVIAVA